MIDKQRLGTFVLGGAVGALVGILLTPRSGRELRGSIAERAGEARDRSRESYFETQERLRERISEIGDAEPRRPAEAEKASFGPASGPAEETETPSGTSSGSEPSNPRLRGLRDVSKEMPESLAQPENDRPGFDRSEELRRKVRETRDRLRKRTEGPGGGQGQ